MSDNDNPVSNNGSQQEEQPATDEQGDQSAAPPEGQGEATEEQAAAPPRELTEADRAKLAELDEALAKYESQKRWSDVIRTIVAKAEIVVEPADKVALFSQAGRMYLEKSSNQAEAIKCFQRVMEIERHNVEAITLLKEMYDKRRDWAHLIEVMGAEAELLPPEDQAARHLEIAKLATERLRKPDVCIGLWQKVLEHDAENPDALEALSSLYERAREWQSLAEVLEKRSHQIAGASDLVAALQKLGMIYADKLNDDDGAVKAFKRLLEIEPSDRRAQEQLKKRYAALKAWDELEEFYATTDKWDELIRILEREAEDPKMDPEERIAMHFRVARLWRDKKEKPDRAARAYEKVFGIDKENLEAAEALTPIYEQAADARKLAEVYEVRLLHYRESEQRLMLLREAGLLYEEKLRNPGSAFDKFLEAFALDPVREVLREDIERVAPKVEGWERVFAVYEQAIEGAVDPDRATRLRVDYGRALSNTGKVEEAIVQYDAVYQDNPDHEGALAALEELYRKTGNHQQLMGVLQRRSEIESDAEARKQLVYEIARLLVEQLGDPDRAIDVYNDIIGEYGDTEREAYSALDGLYEQRERWDDLAQALERRIELGPESEEELASLRFRLADVLENRLGDKVRALDLYREVLSIMPDHEGAVTALERLMQDEQLGGEAALILEPLYESAAQWQKLVGALEVLLGFTQDLDQRLDRITKIGEVYGEQLQEPAGAFEAYCRALTEAPDNPGIYARLEGLAAEQDRFPQLVALLEEMGEKSEDVLTARGVWIKAARIHDAQLEDTDAAVRAYSKALEREPEDLEILGAMEELFRRIERWRDLLGVLRRRVELAPEIDQKESLLAQMAFIHDEMLSEPEEAIRIFAEILELDPDSRMALTALDQLFERQQMWSELADNVRRQLSLADEEEQQIALMLKLGDLHEKRMNAVEAAIEIYRDVLDRNPDNEEALAALERLIEQTEHQVAIAEILEPLYRDKGEIQKLIGVHEIQTLHASSSDQRVALLHRMAELYGDILNDLENSFKCYARALAEDPTSLDTQEQLDNVTETSGMWQQLAQVYEEQIGRIEDASLTTSFHMKAAVIREERLGDAEGAVSHYVKALELDELNLEAAEALERLYQMSERYEELAGVYLKKAGILDIPEERKGYYFRAAAIYEEILERPVDAIEVYKKSLEVEPDDIAALNKLIELHLRLENWEQLLAVYSQKADIVDDPEEKKALYAEVGAVYERELKQMDKAIDTYQRILEIDPDDMTAIGRLDALYLATGNWEELLSVLEREADLAVDPSEVISYRYRIGELWEKKLNDPERAVEVYRDILGVAPDHEATLQALETMMAEEREAVGVSVVLESVYQATGDSEKLIRALEVQNKHEEDPIRKVELLHRIAELYEIHLGQPREAFDAYARSLPHDTGGDVTLGSLERLAEQLSAWNEVARLYDIEIEKLREQSPDSAIDMALRLAQIFEVQIGDVDQAIARYRIVYEADPGHIQSIESLDRLYEATERWSELAEILKKEVEVAGSPDEVLALQFRLGQVYQGYLGDVDQAIEQYREILAAEPEHTQAMSALEMLFAEEVQPIAIGEILEPLFRMQEAWDRLIGVQEVQLRYQDNAEERISMMHRMAETAEEKIGDHAGASVWMQRALMEDPAHDHSIEEGERLAAIVDGWAVLANTYAGVLESCEEGQVRVDLGKRLARIYEEELGDVQRAEETYRFIIGVDERNEDALQALDRIYTEHGAFAALAETLRKRVAAAEDSIDGIELNYRLATVLDRNLDRVDESITVYRHILDDLESEHEDTIKSLQDIYTRREDWPNLFWALEKELDVAVGDSVQAEILGRMASVASDKLDDMDKAVGLLRRVLDLSGEDPIALNALGNIYARQENWTDLVDVLEREVSVTDDDDMRLHIYADLGRVWYEKLRRDRNALESWERVLDLDPGYTDALFAMADIHRNAESHSDLVDTLHRVIEVGSATLENSVLENVYLELGALYDEKLSQPFDSVECYNHALDVNPGSFQAMDELEKIHTRESQWEDCIAVKEKRVDALESAEDKIAVLLEVAKMWEEQVEDRDRGVSAYNRIIELDPTHQLAFEQLEELHREASRFEELIGLYLGRVEAIADNDQRVLLLRKVAKVSEEDLGDRNQAFEALQLAWTQDFENEETAKELERSAGLTQRWNEVLTAANESLQQLPPDEINIKIAICLKCARWYGREGHPEYAIPYLQQVLTIDPVNLAAMRQMAELYRQTQQWDAYSKTLFRMVEMTEDPAERADVYVKMGELNETQFASVERAVGDYKKALENVSENLEALQALERIYRGREQWLELVEILQKKVAVYAETEQSVDVKLQLAEVYEDRVADKSKAIDQYKRVLEEDEVNLEALKGLERLYAQTERWQDLLEVLEGQLGVVTSEKEQIALLMRIAGMWEEEFLKPENSVERLERIVEIDADHTGALQGLERLYRQLQRWDDLIQTYYRHVDATVDRREKVDLYLLMGEAYRDELKDIDQAIDAFLNVTSIDEDNVKALDALTRLYEKRGEHSSALDSMEKLSKLIQEPERLVDIYFRMGTLFNEQLGDRLTAVEYFQKAVDIDSSNLPSLEAIRDIHVEEGDWLAAARVLELATEVEKNKRHNAELRVELGRIYEERLDEHERAVECFEEALKQDPDNEDAAMPLVDEYAAKERWQEAEPLLQMLVKRAGDREHDEQHRLWFLLGQCADNLRDDETAVKAYTQAFSLDSQHLPSLTGLAMAYFRIKDWEKAFKYHQMVLVHHRDELGREETTETLYRLGIIKKEQGENRKALNMFDKALEEDPDHRPTMEALVALYGGENDFEQVIHFKKLILGVADSDHERFMLYEEIGDLWLDKLKNPAKAIEAFAEASDLQPDNHRMLHKLLNLYQQTRQWAAAIEIIARVADLDERSEAKAKYAYTVGVIQRDELKDPDSALEKFDEALDLDPSLLKAFESINKILTQKKDWKQLERAFRKMLHRISGTGDETLEFNLWHNLGVIYRDRQRSFEHAAEAFAMASRLQPNNLQEHQILAEIYATLPHRLDDAIKEHHALIGFDPYRVESYRSLYKLYFDARAYDKAWCLAAALAFLNKADTEQQQFFEQYRQRGPIRPQARLNNERWVKDLFHRDEDFLVGKVFEAITPAVLRIRGKPDKFWQLNKKQLIQDLSNTTVTFARTFGFVAQVLNLPFTPRLFVCPDRQGGLAFAATHPPASICGSALLSGLSPNDLMFVVAKHLSYYRGEHYLKTMFQTKDEIKLVLLAAMKISGVDLKDPNVDKWAAEIQANMEPADMELLNSVRKRFVEGGARTDVKRWMQTVEITGCRAGLLMCNDLGIASRMIQSEPPMGTVDLPAKEKVKELVLFSISERYFRLREAMGIQIQVG